MREGEAAGGGRDGEIEGARRAFYKGFVAEAIGKFCATQDVLDSTGRRFRGFLGAQHGLTRLLDKHFVLTGDVNLADVGPDGVLPIGTRGLPFCGSLDGQGHTISGLTCDISANYAGLFGGVGASRDDPNRAGRVAERRTFNA
mgnify:CR=1 FL=1